MEIVGLILADGHPEIIDRTLFLGCAEMINTAQKMPRSREEEEKNPVDMTPFLEIIHKAPSPRVIITHLRLDRMPREMLSKSKVCDNLSFFFFFFLIQFCIRMLKNKAQIARENTKSHRASRALRVSRSWWAWAHIIFCAPANRKSWIRPCIVICTPPPPPAHFFPMWKFGQNFGRDLCCCCCCLFVFVQLLVEYFVEC